MSQPISESTVARIAGNIAGTVLAQTHDGSKAMEENALTIVAAMSVYIARAIVSEVQRTAPKDHVAEKIV